MITQTDANLTPMPLQLYQTKGTGLVYSVPAVVPDSDYCWCRYACKYTLPVFAGETDLTNDKSDLRFIRYGTTDTVTMKLYKEGTEVATLDDNTYGVYSDFGSQFNSEFKGFLINWKLVYAAFGSGEYQVITTAVWIGTTYTINSSYYQLEAWDEELADGTVRIETRQNGLIENNPIDYTSMNWYGQIRVYGEFRKGTPELVTSNYQSSDRAFKQVQDAIHNTYSLELFKMTGTERDTFINEMLLANSLTFTDYSLANDDKWKQVDVYPESIERLVTNIDRPGSHGMFRFKEKVRSTIKRNFSF